MSRALARKRFVSIRSKFMLFAFVLTLFPLLIVGGFSYFESTKVIRSQTIDLNLIHAKQLADNLGFIMNDVNTISLNLIQNADVASYLAADPAQKQQYRSEVLAAMADQTFNKKYVYSVYLQDADGNGFDNKGAVNLIPSSRLQQAKASKGKESWFLDDVFVQNQEVHVISMIRDVRDVNRVSRSLGIVKINVLETSVRDLYRNRLHKDSLFYLVDQDRRIVSALSEDEIGDRIKPCLDRPAIAGDTEGFFNAEIGGTDYLAVYFRIDPLGWNMIEATPYPLISKSGDVIRKVTFYSIAASLAVCLAFVVLFAVRVLKPLKQIRVLMKNVEQENFNLQMNEQGNDEITLLARSFNRMSQKLNELINDVHASKLKQKEAEIKALEEQINPHFLYNTLDLIYWMSRMEKAFETSLMINALSQLFRIGLNRGSRFTTVAKEVEHIRHYIMIQQKRYEETIRFAIDAEPETLDCKVTKMVLQPLVENAILHGMERKGGEGRIDIRIYRDPENGDLVYRVSDDGAGADAEAVMKLLAGEAGERQGMGLKNIHDRIRLHYGSPYGIEFFSDKTHGTTVTVKQPFVKG